MADRGLKGIQVVGRRVAELRHTRFFSQEKLARAAGMSRENLRRIEGSEETGIQSENFLNLATAFNLTPDELLSKIGANGHADSPIVTALTQAASDPEKLKQAVVELPPEQLETLRDAIANALEAGKRQRIAAHVPGVKGTPRKKT